MIEDAGLPSPPPEPSNSLLASALESVANAIFITDAAGQIVWVNKAFSQLSGYAAEEVLGNTPAILKSGRQHGSLYRELWQTIQSGNVWRGTMVDRRKDGECYTVDQTITPLLDRQGAITHFVAIQLDAGSRASKDEEDHYLAYHDALTRLSNRARFCNIEKQQVALARRTGEHFAVMFLDLDRFKEVNDTFGHWIGDQLLVAVSERLSSVVRKFDTVARLGGDEFAVLLPAVSDTTALAAIARKLNEAIAQPFRIEGKVLCIGVSIGVSCFPEDGEDGDILLRKADEAMYRAKKRGGNTYQLCSDAPIKTRAPHQPYGAPMS